MARSFADKLDQLFATVRKPDGSAWSLTDVVASVNAAGETKLSASYLSELRSGRKTQPNIWVANALARFFGQPLEYFVEDDMDPVMTTSARRDVVSEPELKSFAGRLAALLRVVEPHGEPDPTDDQLSRWMAQAGFAVTAAEVGAVRAGKKAHPPAALVSSLANYFGVPQAFLTDAEVARAMSSQLRLMNVLANKDIRRIAMRANSLDASDQQRVADLVARLGGDSLDETQLDF